MMIRFHKELIFVLVIGLFLAVARKSQVVHKITHRDSFVRTHPASADGIHELVFAIRQKNLVELDRVAIERSTPENPLYQNWLTFEEVGALISNHEATQAVTGWLAENNVPVTWTSGHSEYIKASAKVSTWESLLNTKFHVFEDRAHPANADGAYPSAIRTTEYSLPEHMVPHLSTVFNTVQAPPVTTAARLAAVRKQKEPVAAPASASANKHVETQGVVTVDFLNSMYNIASNTGNVNMQQVIYEYRQNFYYSPDDLTQFQQTYNLPVQAAEHPTGYNTSDCSTDTTGDLCYWSNLEVQYLMGVAQQTTTVYKHVSLTDPVSSWITNAPDGNPPQVNVFPWAYDQQSLSADVLGAFNTEALKLTSMGVTLIAESGDGGAAGDAAHCTQDSSSSTFTYWTGDSWFGVGYFPQFPATCPYVTTVGGTMGQESGQAQVACQSQLGGVVTSGGGFSAYDYTPTWQIGAVNGYFNSLNTGTYPTEGYNGAGRAYPDVSLISVWYEAIVAGSTLNLFTTGASSTVLAAMVSLVNAARATAGKPTIGFMNPTLYATSSASRYQDVTSGINKCMPTNDIINPSTATCCASGFYAAVGWDPVTGWGSVDYPTLLSMFDYAPSAMPTRRPTSKPTTKPTIVPSRMPTRKPTSVPTVLGGSVAPTVSPTAVPSRSPTASPTVATTGAPTAAPSATPTDVPSGTPTESPSVTPSALPSAIPSALPSAIPSAMPSANPTLVPTVEPSAPPSEVPSPAPTATPSELPTAMPSALPTVAPSQLPTVAFTDSPTVTTTLSPTPATTENPVAVPTVVPSVAPSVLPTSGPTVAPSTTAPTLWPTARPTAMPTSAPTTFPTAGPTRAPTRAPTNPTPRPTQAPSALPTKIPTKSPTRIPTRSPTNPTPRPTQAPTRMPTKTPTNAPTRMPTRSPTNPTPRPTQAPSKAPTKQPSQRPTAAPTRTPTFAPSRLPTARPTASPTRSPTNPTPRPTQAPSRAPTRHPSQRPTASPTRAPSAAPSKAPTFAPTRVPTCRPSAVPTRAPSRAPTFAPTRQPTNPTALPTKVPSAVPTRVPTLNPTRTPSTAPTFAPSRLPTTRPTASPTRAPSAAPSKAPTVAPSRGPTAMPTRPTARPTASPTFVPTISPTRYPTKVPFTSKSPTALPTKGPMSTPTLQPVAIPRTNEPIGILTQSPRLLKNEVMQVDAQLPAVVVAGVPATAPTDTVHTPASSSDAAVGNDVVMLGVTVALVGLICIMAYYVFHTKRVAAQHVSELHVQQDSASAV